MNGTVIFFVVCSFLFRVTAVHVVRRETLDIDSPARINLFLVSPVLQMQNATRYVAKRSDAPLWHTAREAKIFNSKEKKFMNSILGCENIRIFSAFIMSNVSTQNQNNQNIFTKQQETMKLICYLFYLGEPLANESGLKITNEPHEPRSKIIMTFFWSNFHVFQLYFTFRPKTYNQLQWFLIHGLNKPNFYYF